MFKAKPSDVIVLGIDSLTFVRLRAGKKTPQLVQAKRIRTNTMFAPAAVTPHLEDPAALAEALNKVRREAGSLDRVALLLPDSWFRLNLIELTQLPDRKQEADEVVRWTLKKSLPIAPELLRMAWIVVGKHDEKRRLLVVSAVEKSLATIEQTFRETGIDVIVVEPLGLNLWNALSGGETGPGERLLVHVAQGEFTTALFRGEEPVFLRSRNLHGDRSVSQEIRLSASYLRENLQPSRIEACWLADPNGDPEVVRSVSEHFGNVKNVDASAFAAIPPGIDAATLAPEIVASTGVFRT